MDEKENTGAESSAVTAIKVKVVIDTNRKELDQQFNSVKEHYKEKPVKIAFGVNQNDTIRNINDALDKVVKSGKLKTPKVTLDVKIDQSKVTAQLKKAMQSAAKQTVKVDTGKSGSTKTQDTSKSDISRLFSLANRQAKLTADVAALEADGRKYSDRILFYCHSEPYLASTELTLGKVKTINFPSYSFDFSYNYPIAEGEVINRYEYYLYDENKELITQSNCFYYRDSMKSFDVNGLDNHTTYYVRAKAESVGGFQLDTGFLQIYTDYTEAIGDAQITATNDKWGAQIDLYAKYYLTQSTGVNAVRFKRRKKGTAQWMTIYQESIVLNRLAVKVAWTNQHINESGVVSTSNSSVLSDYLSIGRINSYHFRSTDKQFGLRAYSSTKSFLGATKFYSSGSEFRASSEALTSGTAWNLCS